MTVCPPGEPVVHYSQPPPLHCNSICTTHITSETQIPIRIIHTPFAPNTLHLHHIQSTHTLHLHDTNSFYTTHTPSAARTLHQRHKQPPKTLTTPKKLHRDYFTSNTTETPKFHTSLSANKTLPLQCHETRDHPHPPPNISHLTRFYRDINSLLPKHQRPPHPKPPMLIHRDNHSKANTTADTTKPQTPHNDHHR